MLDIAMRASVLRMCGCHLAGVCEGGRLGIGQEVVLSMQKLGKQSQRTAQPLFGRRCSSKVPKKKTLWMKMVLSPALLTPMGS